MFFRRVFQGITDRIKCLAGRHVYIPAYEVRQLYHPNGRYSHKEFRFECSCCQRKTQWMRWRRLDAFQSKHQPKWNHYRFRNSFS